MKLAIPTLLFCSLALGSACTNRSGRDPSPPLVIDDSGTGAPQAPTLTRESIDAVGSRELVSESHSQVVVGGAGGGSTGSGGGAGAPAAPVPEPMTLFLVGSGLVLAGAARCRRPKTSAAAESGAV